MMATMRTYKHFRALCAILALSAFADDPNHLLPPNAKVTLHTTMSGYDAYHRANEWKLFCISFALI
jgi:hypothetical protein